MRQYPDINIQCYEMLHHCSMQHGLHFKSKLIQALKESGLQEVAEKLNEKQSK